MSTYVMDKAVGQTRLDAAPQPLLGKPLDRYEGALKVCGKARYAVENLTEEPVAYGYLATSGVGRATLRSIDTSAAEAAPEVLAVIAGDRIPRSAAQPMSPAAQTVDGEVFHYGQPLALVVATTFEAARHAARLIRVETSAQPGRYVLAPQCGQARKSEGGVMPADTTRGDFEKAFSESDVRFDQTYTTPSHHSSAMEPHGSVARWDGQKLTVWSSCQLLESNLEQIANGVGIPKENVRLLSPYVGGGFGSKLGIGPDAVLAALGAKAARRPVKVALSRQQVLQTTSRRSETIQRVRIGADRTGRITALAHETWSANSPGNDFFEPAGVSTVFLYAGDHRRVTHRLAETDVLMTSAVRAPGEAVGMLALENAMDEMAEKLGLDPVEFRRRNEPESDPQEGKPFSSRRLLDCYEEGARRFGWADRPRTPASRREGEWLVGYGMAAASRSNSLMKSSAEVVLDERARSP